MADNILYIKNMACKRCIISVERCLNLLDIKFNKVLLGEAHLENEIPNDLCGKLSDLLSNEGFELLIGSKAFLIGKIKYEISNLICHLNKTQTVRLPAYFEKKLHHSFNYLDSLFSSVESITIDRYFELQKTERIKELLMNKELSLEEIAQSVGYRSVKQLSHYFKKTLGISPDKFRKLDFRKPKFYRLPA